MNECTGCTTTLRAGDITDAVFDCHPPGFVQEPGYPGCFQNPILAFCSFTCAVAYCESRCPCGGACWKVYDVEPLLTRLAAAEARAGVTL